MEKTQNFKSTVFACYRGYITQGIVNNLSPLFFVLFQNKFGISYSLISALILCNFVTQVITDRNFTSAGYSASSVEKYHYPSDCHRRNRGNLLLIPGVLAVLQCRSHGVPDKVAKIIRIKVLVNDLFSCQNTSEWADLFVVRN